MRELQTTVMEAKEAERHILASMLVDEIALDYALSVLTVEDFYGESHKVIFSAISDLRGIGKYVDVLTVNNVLKLTGNEDIKQVMYFLTDSVATSQAIEGYCEIVIDESTKRKLVTAARNIERKAQSGDEKRQELIEFSESTVLAATERQGDSKVSTAAETVADAIHSIEAAQMHGNLVGVPTFFQDIDEMMGGFEEGSYNIVAGRPSMGKTAMMLSMAIKQAIENKIPVAIFSLEMPKRDLGKRILAMLSGWDSFKIRVGRVNLNDTAITDARDRFAAAPIYIDDSPFLNVHRLRSSVRRLQKMYGVKVIYVDHVHLMAYDQNDPVQGVTAISKGIKEIGRRFNIPMVGMCQLSRLSVQQKGDKRPRLSDLRQSGALEQDADTVSFIHREFVYTRKEVDRNRAEFIISKQRNGPTGEACLDWHSHISQFTNHDIANDF